MGASTSSCSQVIRGSRRTTSHPSSRKADQHSPGHDKHLLAGRRPSNAATGVYAGDTTPGGTRDGAGKFSYSNGDWYEGEWDNGKAHGKGTFWTRQSTYVGYWEQDLKHGEGEEKFEDGTVYKGQYRNGFRHGHGVLTWSDGSMYEGEFANNSQEGQGVYLSKTRHKYSGQWEDNYMHGRGTYEWADGSSYAGQYVMNLKDGDGVFTSKLGHRMACKWSDGRPTGPVTFQARAFDSRPTRWQEGVMVSWGTCSEDVTPRSKEGSPRNPAGSPRGAKRHSQLASMLDMGG